MKKLKMVSAWILVCIGLMSAPVVMGQKSGKAYYYQAKSGVIEYVYSGQTTGKETWYFDQNGRLSARYSEFSTKSLGSTTKSQQISIQRDSTFYTIDLLTKTGIKTTIRFDEKELKEMAETAEKIWKDMGFEKTGEGEVLGRKCDIWEGMSTKIWVWQNFALKTETSMMGKTVMEATKIDLNVPVDKSKFAVPDGIEITDQHINAADPVFDSLGKSLEKGLEEFKGLFKKK